MPALKLSVLRMTKNYYQTSLADNTVRDNVKRIGIVIYCTAISTVNQHHF